MIFGSEGERVKAGTVPQTVECARTRCNLSLDIAQRLELLTSNRKVTGSTPVINTNALRIRVPLTTHNRLRELPNRVARL